MTTPLLAEITEGEKWILGCTIATTIFGFVALLLSFFAFNKKQEVRVEQPLEVQFAAEFVHQTEFEKHVALNLREHENLFHKLGGAERGIEGRINARLDKMESNANESRQSLGQRVEDVRRELSEKCDEIPDRVIATLKNTGAI